MTAAQYNGIIAALSSTPGIIAMYGGAVAPTGWLLCDGSTVNRVTYAALFSAVGTAFGAGDGSTTFKLPDLRGRSPLGVGTGSGLTARTMGASGGEETHVLTDAEMPVHDHGTGVLEGDFMVFTDNPKTIAAGTDIAHTTTPLTAPAGSDTAHNTMHPYQVVNYIIKT